MSDTITRRPRRGRGSYAWYLAPIVVGFLAVVAVPFAANVAISFTSWRGGLDELTFQGLDNYRRLLSDATFWDSLGNSLYMVVAIVVVPTVLGLLIAATLFDVVGRRFGGRAAAVLRATYYLPQIVPIAVAGFVWAWVLDTQDGVLTKVLQGMGFAHTPDWLGDPDVALYSVMLMLVWLQIGYPVVIFMAALQRVDPELYEAAELDGAGWFRRFQAITLPQIRPEVFVVVLTGTVASLKVFAPILLLTNGGPEGSTVVPSYYAYRNFFELSRVGYGATISTVMALAIFVVASALLVWQSKADRNEAGR
ncbi:carbohydrate ABC transporter permease [Isoptericola variabilis]|uniref:carbohydrate ABC transporter permease n=1 Tax=Isoptericola variabilis TaxID=139208 RepID=UPI003D23E4C7